MSLPLDPFRDLVRHLRSRGPLLAGIAEDTEPVELGLFHEMQQLLEILLRLTGEADDEGGADCDVGDLAPQPRDQLPDFLLACCAGSFAARTGSLMCCMGMSRYLQTFFSFLISSISLSVTPSG